MMSALTLSSGFWLVEMHIGTNCIMFSILSDHCVSNFITKPQSFLYVSTYIYKGVCVCVCMCVCVVEPVDEVLTCIQQSTIHKVGS